MEGFFLQRFSPCPERGSLPLKFLSKDEGISMQPVSLATARQYSWGGTCLGWHLTTSPKLSVIQERIPSGSGETLHLHEQAEQFFFILAGTAVFELDGATMEVKTGEGLRVDPGHAHLIRNQGKEALEILLISSPPAQGDRKELSHPELKSGH